MACLNFYLFYILKLFPTKDVWDNFSGSDKSKTYQIEHFKTRKYGTFQFYQFSDVRLISFKFIVGFKGPVSNWF